MLRIHPVLALCAAAGITACSAPQQDVVDEGGVRPSVAATSDTSPPPLPPSSGVPPSPPPPASIPPGNEGPAPGAGTTLRISESSQYGADEIIGVLQVTDATAYFQHDQRRISLVQAAPVTGMGAEPLMAETAQALRRFAGQRVRARGELQGATLWEAKVAAPN